MKPCAPHRQSGLTLIEVLVSILIFSFGLLGLVGLQVRAIQYSVSAEDSNRAALLANELAWEMVTRRTVDLPADRISAWQTRVGDTSNVGLPNGQGDLDAPSGANNNIRTITIQWRAPGAASGAANSMNRYVTQVILPEVILP